MSLAIASHFSACCKKFKVHLAFVFPSADVIKDIKCQQMFSIGQVFGQWGTEYQQHQQSTFRETRLILM